MMRNIITLFFLAACSLQCADKQIGVIAHIGFRVADLEKTRAYYNGKLRMPQAFDQKDAAGKTTLVVYQVSANQFLEFTPGAPVGFTHIAFLTDKLDDLHKLVETLGLNPPELRTGRDRTSNFSLKDPDSHRIEFVQYEADSLQAQARAKFVPNQVVWGIHDIGLPVADREATKAFFRKLNFQENQPGKLSPAWEQNQWIELLPATDKVHLRLQVGDDSPPRSGLDPDGVPVDMVSVN
jgi:catechol 2,3-dioxygenase-like lactoylglutathione lyase family enzyme